MSEEKPSIELVCETSNENQDSWYTVKEPFNEEEEKLFKMLVTLLGSIEGYEIPPMRNVDKKRLSGASTKVDAMFKNISLNITTLNKVMYFGGIMISELLGVKNSKDKPKNYPMQKKRLENQIRDICKDLDPMIKLSKGNKLKKKHSDQLQWNYFLKQKSFVYVMEEIRQQIKSKRAKLNRYNNRVNKYQQNRIFRNNERMLYKKLNGDSNNKNTNSTPDENKSREFWKKIWGINKVHHKDAEWLPNIKLELLNLDCEEDIIIFKKRPQENAPKAPLLEGPWKSWITGILDKSF